jgi:HlyD family secretion protein
VSKNGQFFYAKNTYIQHTQHIEKLGTMIAISCPNVKSHQKNTKMDRVIPKEEIIRQRNLNIAKITAISVAVFVVLWVAINKLKTSVSFAEITVSEAAVGAIEVSLSATGRVVPYFERVITSPINSQVLEIVRFPGDSVKTGDVILRLDLSNIRNEYQRMHDEQQIKKSKLQQARVTTSTQQADLKLKLEIEALKLEKMASDLRNEQYMNSIGGASKEQVNNMRLQNETAQLEYRRLEQSTSNYEATSQADLNVQEIEYAIHFRTLNETARKLEDSEIRSPASAIVTWVKDEIGSKVAEGTELVRLADLSRFKVEGEMADVYADRLRTGSDVVVKIGTLKLDGTVSNIRPSVKNGTVTFNIELAESNHPRLRAGLKTDVYVISSFKEAALRIANGSYYTGKGEYDLWVVRAGEATQRKLRLGDSNYEFVEVLEGLSPGEQVIVSNMDNYKNRKKIKVK